MGYPIIMNGDHAEFEQEWAGKDPKTRPDWPLPSFDARDWAEAFCKRAREHGDDPDEGWMITWFANALMRGFDEHAARSATNMRWESAAEADIDLNAYYVVQHNGHEWRDFDLAVLNGTIVAHRLGPDYVRGRPEWIAKIVRPVTTGNREKSQ